MTKRKAREFRVATILLVTGLAALSAPAGGQPSAVHPVDEILARHARAVGAVELAKTKSLKVSGTFNFNGIDSPYTVYRLRPDRYRFEVETEVGLVVTAFDGETAWSTSPDRAGEMRVEAMEGTARQRFIDENVDFDGPLIDWHAKGHKAELAGEVEVDGAPAYQLNLTLASGSVHRWLLAKDDARALRKIAPATHRRHGPYDRTWYLMEHQTTGGITLPFYVEREDRQHVRAYIVETVEVGVEIDPALFRMPAAPGGP